MFSDEEYKEATRTFIHTERNRICERLSSCKDLKVYPASANFVLVRILKEEITSSDLFDAAIQKGYMIRDCSTFPFLDNHYIRFCFMYPKQNDKLVDIILDTLS